MDMCTSQNRRKRSKKQIKISDDTKISHHYIFVATLFLVTFTTEDILAIYYLQWQVDWLLKDIEYIVSFPLWQHELK